VLAASSGALGEESSVTKVRLGFFPNVTHAQALLGVGRGDFDRAFAPDARVTSQTFNAGPAVIEALFGGGLDIAYVGPSPAINGFIRSKGEEVRVVAGAAANGVLIVANKKRGLNSLDDLRGKKIATPQLGNTQDISAKYYVVETLKSQLRERGGETDVVPVQNADIEILFEKDQLDAAWVPEPWASRLVHQGTGVILAEEKDLWPGKEFALTNVIVRREFLEHHPDLVKRFLKAHLTLTAELAADPARHADAINAELRRLTTKQLPAEVMRNALSHVKFTADPSKESLARFHEKGRALGLLPDTPFDTDRLVDTRLLAELQSGDTGAAKGAAATTPSGGTRLNLFPTPVEVWHSITQLWRDGLLLSSLSQSMGRMFVGYFISVVGGILLGVLAARSRLFRNTAGAVILALQSLPSICWLPFALIWVGINETAIIVVVVLGALFSIAVATEGAVRNIPPIYQKVGLVLGARGPVFWRDILFPAALPQLVGGLKLGWSFAWRSLMAAELIRQDVLGVGRLLETGRNFNDVPMMVAAILIILAIGLFVDRAVFGTIEARIRRRYGLEK
jgi:NitT/TauT family transport system substrate-binding protein